MRLLTGSAAFCFVLLAGAVAAQPRNAEPLTLPAAFARALSVNPAIVAARTRRQADLANVAVARERLNPEARVEIERETPTQSYGLTIPWETAGKRSRRVAVSEAAVETGAAEIARTELEVRTAVRRAYYARVVADARLGLVGEAHAIAVRVRDTAQQRFDAGSAPRLEVLQAQLALAQVENETLLVAGSATAARTELNALLALPLDAETPLATTLDAPGELPPPAVVMRAAAANSELSVIDRRIAEQRARVALARALQTPDVTPELQVTRGAEPEFSTGWRTAVAVALPIFTTHRAGVLLEEATLAQLQREREAAASRIAGEVASALALAEAHRAMYIRYRDEILPQAREVERIAEDAYRLGQTGLAAFLQALQATREARLQSLQAAADLQAALADLERTAGTVLP